VDTQTLLTDAVRRHRAGNLSGAEPLYARILHDHPDHAEALYLLGSLQAQRGQTDAAIASLQRALQAAPELAEAHNNLANALAAAGRLAEAEQCYRCALELRADNPEALCNLAAILERQSRHGEAADILRRAAELRPRDATTLNAWGMSLRGAGRLTDAVAVYRRALELAPDAPELHNNLGNALEELGQHDAAQVRLRRAVRLRPAYAEAWGNLAGSLQAIGRLDEALECYRRGLELRPDLDALRGNRAWIRLLLGEYREGFADYEHRYACGTLLARALPKPRWDGRSLAGRTILLYAEQGFGDTIQFARYAPLVAALGGRVMLACQPELAPLLSRLEGVERVIASTGGAPKEPFDCHAPLPSLPFLLGTTLETIPAKVPYLHARAELIERWRCTIGSGPGLRVGLVWAGNPVHSRDPQRSCPPEVLAPLASLPVVRLFALQKGITAADVARIGGSVTDLGREIRDFDDTAAAVMCLDLVVTVDTSMAHLAGALSRPVWTLIAHQPDWRWMQGRADSPWYPTMRLFRQPRAGDWRAVVGRVVEELRKCRSR
jgi:Flp pilus assembly protein TadD